MKESKVVGVKIPMGDYKRLVDKLGERKLSISDYLVGRIYLPDGNLAGMEGKEPDQDALSGTERKRQIATRVKEKRAAARSRRKER